MACCAVGQHSVSMPHRDSQPVPQTSKPSQYLRVPQEFGDKAHVGYGHATHRVSPTGGPADSGQLVPGGGPGIQPESPFIPIYARNKEKSSGPLVMTSDDAPLQHPKAQFARPLGQKDPGRSREAERRSSWGNSKDLGLERKPGVVEIPGHSQTSSAFQHISHAGAKTQSNGKGTNKVILMKSDSPKAVRRRLEDEYPNIDVEPHIKTGYSMASIRGPDIRLLSRQRPKSMPGPDYDLSQTSFDGQPVVRRRPRSMEGLLGDEFTGRDTSDSFGRHDSDTAQRHSRLQQKLQSPVKKRSRSLERGLEEFRRNLHLDGAVSDSEAVVKKKHSQIIDDFPLSIRHSGNPQLSRLEPLQPLHVTTQFESPETTPALLPMERPRPRSMPYSVDTKPPSGNLNPRPLSLAAGPINKPLSKWQASLFDNKQNWGNTPPWREAAVNKAYINSVYESPKPRGHRKTRSWDAILDTPNETAITPLDDLSPGSYLPGNMGENDTFKHDDFSPAPYKVNSGPTADLNMSLHKGGTVDPHVASYGSHGNQDASIYRGETGGHYEGNDPHRATGQEGFGTLAWEDYLLKKAHDTTDGDSLLPSNRLYSTSLKDNADTPGWEGLGFYYYTSLAPMCV